MRHTVSRRRSHNVMPSSNQETNPNLECVNGSSQNNGMTMLAPVSSSSTVSKLCLLSNPTRRMRRVRRLGASSSIDEFLTKSPTGACLLSVGLCFVGICSLILVLSVHFKLYATAQTESHIVLSAALFDDRASTGVRGTKNINQTILDVPISVTEWYNDHNLVHVVQTRFMQNQPNLLALGQARLDLFRSLTIPSMQHQTLQQFLWIVRTDPHLHPVLLEQLKKALAPLPNAVLVASNNNPEGWRCPHCISDITEKSVLVGSFDLVRSYHSSATFHSVLETRCDADDAISVDFVELLQTSATSGLRPLNNDWMVWCAENHLEWQYDSPWTTYQNDTKGKGALLALKAGHCITPGLTWGYTVNASRSDIPVFKHQKIRQVINLCGSRIGLDGETLLSKCLVRLGGEFPLALRARTPTSAGMEHVLIANVTEDRFPLDRLQHSKFRSTQNELWDVLGVLFGVTSENLWNVRTRIERNLFDIARDALEGQCTKGHSCKESSKEVLLRLSNSTWNDQTQQK